MVIPFRAFLPILAFFPTRAPLDKDENNIQHNESFYLFIFLFIYVFIVSFKKLLLCDSFFQMDVCTY